MLRVLLRAPVAVVVAGVVVVGVVGCGGEAGESVSLTPAAIARATELEQVYRQYAAAWDAQDLAALAATLADDFVFNEPGKVNLPKAEYLDFMEPFVNLEIEHGATDFRFLVGGDDLIEPHLAWGFGGATEENPLVEVEVLTIQDGKITSIRSLYGAEVLERHGRAVPTELAYSYLAAWSSGDAAQVEALYPETARRSEPLYDTELEGREPIGRYAATFFQRHAGDELSLVEPYIFSDGDPAHPNIGVLLSLIDPSGCTVEYGVLLEGDDTGAVASERVYYNLDSIQACDWQR
jgi:ketosteroid isomerase-like protein